jgi:PAS domain S-box-containing protein
VETAEALIATMDATGTLDLINRRCEELCGTARDEAIGRSFLDLFVTEEQREEVQQRFEEALQDGGGHPSRPSLPAAPIGACAGT